MGWSRPRVIGLVLVAVGLVVGLGLALAQSARETMLNEPVIAVLFLIAALAITAGLTMIIRNRRIRTDRFPPR